MKRFILAATLLIALSVTTPAGIVQTPGYCGEETCPPPPCTANCEDELNQSTDLFTDAITSFVTGIVSLI